MKQEDRSKISRNNITESALFEFAENGYERTSIQKVCLRAEISKGGFYHHFNSKEDLFISCCEWLACDIETILDGFKLDLSADIEQNMLRLAQLLLEISREKPYLKPILFYAMFLPPAKCEEQLYILREKTMEKIMDIAKEKVSYAGLKTSPEEVIRAFFIPYLFSIFSQGLSDWAISDPELCKNASRRHKQLFKIILHDHLYGALDEHDRGYIKYPDGQIVPPQPEPVRTPLGFAGILHDLESPTE